MKESYKILNANEVLSLEEIKKCYLKKVREFPPEDNQEEFLRVRKAYEDIIQYHKYKNQKKSLLMIEVYFEIMKISILKDDVKKFNQCCEKLKEEIDIKNFKLISDEIIEIIITSKKSGKIFFTLELCRIFIPIYERLNLIQLKESYIMLSESLKREIEMDGN